MTLNLAAASRHSLWVRSGRSRANVCRFSSGPQGEGYAACDSLVQFITGEELYQRAVVQSWYRDPLLDERCAICQLDTRSSAALARVQLWPSHYRLSTTSCARRPSGRMPCSRATRPSPSTTLSMRGGESRTWHGHSRPYVLTPGSISTVQKSASRPRSNQSTGMRESCQLHSSRNKRAESVPRDQLDRQPQANRKGNSSRVRHRFS